MGWIIRRLKKAVNLQRGLDDDNPMVVAAKMGLSYSDYMQMDGVEYAAWLRGNDKRDTESLAWLRWAVAALLQPHSKRAIDPKSLIKLPIDDLEKNKVVVKDENKWRQMEETFKQWDNG
ncbi:MAG TPA: hypothetical protein PLV12_00880 [Saprospiraceae bacterium]|nr:hypothetical protein [Saprospiraceae bacterium]